jgi:tetratricopeptide (TPR) repeat protein
MDPDFPRASLIFSAYVQKGMLAEAQTIVEKKFTAGSWWQLASLAYIDGRTGKRAPAERELRKLLDLYQRQPLDPLVIVPAYIGMGNNDQALAWLEKAYAAHSNGLTALKVEPVYDPLRGDPRFENLLRRVGLTQ